tara:strand:- start:1385 stop:1675 length:291 start_codon:yes stop_codon:yes gene_type:complete
MPKEKKIIDPIITKGMLVVAAIILLFLFLLYRYFIVGDRGILLQRAIWAMVAVAIIGALTLLFKLLVFILNRYFPDFILTKILKIVYEKIISFFWK